MENTFYRPKQSQYSHQVMTLGLKIFWILFSTMTVTWKGNMKGVEHFFSVSYMT